MMRVSKRTECEARLDALGLRTEWRLVLVEMALFRCKHCREASHGYAQEGNVNAVL